MPFADFPEDAVPRRLRGELLCHSDAIHTLRRARRRGPALRDNLLFVAACVALGVMLGLYFWGRP